MGACPLPLWPAPGGLEDDTESSAVSGIGECGRFLVISFIC